MTGTISLKQIALGDLEQELAATRRVLEQVPDEHLSWKPNDGAATLGALASHIANLLFWQITILEEDGFDLSSAPPPRPPLASRDEILKTFDQNLAVLRAALATTDDEDLAKPWVLKRDGEVMLNQARSAVLRSIGINHLLHHRGQLMVYLRLLNVAVSPVYGPSVDEGGR